MLLLLIPALKLVPTLYRWRFEFRINRLYGLLQPMERSIFQLPLTLDKRAELIGRLDEVERSTNDIKVPTAFASRLYGLKEHIRFVRQFLLERKLAE